MERCEHCESCESWITVLGILAGNFISLVILLLVLPHIPKEFLLCGICL